MAKEDRITNAIDKMIEAFRGTEGRMDRCTGILYT